jgi:hypothetical protein
MSASYPYSNIWTFGSFFERPSLGQQNSVELELDGTGLGVGRAEVYVVLLPAEIACNGGGAEVDPGAFN